MSKGNGKSSKKCFAYIAAVLVIQAVIILVLALTVLRVKSPKFRFNAMAVESFSSGNNNSSPSIRMRLLTQVTIKNTNFGRFKYGNSTLTVFYNGVPLGEAAIPSGRTKARKTQTFNVSVDVASDSLSALAGSSLGNDMNSGVLRLSSMASLKGKVHLLNIIKRKKSGNMNCNWNINLGTREVEDLRCN